MKRSLVEAIPLFEQLGDRRLRAEALRSLGFLTILEGEFERAQALFVRAYASPARSAIEWCSQPRQVPGRKFRCTSVTSRRRSACSRGSAPAGSRGRVAGGCEDGASQIGSALLGQERLDEAASKFRESLSVRVERSTVGHRHSDRRACRCCSRTRRRANRRPPARRNRGMAQKGGLGEPFESDRADRTAAAPRCSATTRYRGLAAEGARLSSTRRSSSPPQPRPASRADRWA